VIKTHEAAEVERGAVARRGRPRLSGHLEAMALPLAGLAVIAIFSFLRPSTFLTTSNLSSILSSQSVLVVVTLGLMIVLITGDFDLSIGSVVGLSGMVVALLTVEQGVPLPVAIAAAMLSALLIGLINGFFVVVLNINSLIVTLGMGSVVAGAVLWMSDANVISGIPAALVNPVIVWRLFGVPLGFYYAMIVAVGVWYVLRFTPVGRRLLFVGRSREVSSLSGIRVGAVRWGALVVSSGLAGLAGLLYAGTSGAAGPTSGLELLLPAFAAAFLGTTAINPGRFNTWGTVIAVYFLVTGITGFQLLGAQSFVQDLFYGASLVVAVSLSQLARRRRERI
jgi:ribose transport system permease protein